MILQPLSYRRWYNMMKFVTISLMLSTLFVTGRIAYGRISKMREDSSSARPQNMHMKYVTLHSRRRRQVKLYEDVGYRELIGPRRSKPYCAGRRDPRTGNFLPCCPGRDDACKIPYYDTACYCDEFCQRSNSSDCCPDHQEFCGVTGFYERYMHTTTTEKMTRDRSSTRVFSTTYTTLMTTIAPPVTEDFKGKGLLLLLNVICQIEKGSRLLFTPVTEYNDAVISDFTLPGDIQRNTASVGACSTAFTKYREIALAHIIWWREILMFVCVERSGWNWNKRPAFD